MKCSSALVAEDEPLLRKALFRLLTDAWPELKIVAQARNGREAVEQFEALKRKFVSWTCTCQAFPA